MAEKPTLLDACREALRIPAECTRLWTLRFEDIIESRPAPADARGAASPDSVQPADRFETARFGSR